MRSRSGRRAGGEERAAASAAGRSPHALGREPWPRVSMAGDAAAKGVAAWHGGAWHGVLHGSWAGIGGMRLERDGRRWETPGGCSGLYTSL
eukprot:6863072-Prymnesium_polylepis.1